MSTLKLLLILVLMVVSVEYAAVAAAAARRWVREGRIRNAAAIPDERARVLADGSLEIVVEIPGDRVALTVPPDQWAWRHRPS